LIGLSEESPSPSTSRTRSRSQSSRQPRSLSWVVPGKLAVGSLPYSGDKLVFSQNGIRAILSLCDCSEGSLPAEFQPNFKCHQLVLPDSHYAYELEVQQIAEAVEWVHQSIQNQMPVYVHCLAGVERSPTICVAYLCRYYNLELWEAINWLKQAHPASMPTQAQIRVLQAYIQQFCRSKKPERPAP
jgi:atypical dual specificity phosphatase